MEALTGPQTDRDGVGLHKMLFDPLFFSSNKNIVVILILRMAFSSNTPNLSKID